MTEIVKEMTVNMGPQHPSTHGIIRVILTLDGERIKNLDVDAGYLHRGFEKIAENKRYLQVIPFTDRLDYVAAICQNLGYVIAVEKLIDVKPTLRVEYIRLILNELTRIQSHLLWLATYLLDIGALSPLFYTFREREKILDIFEMITGARQTINYYRIATVARDMPPEVIPHIKRVLDELPLRIDEYMKLIDKNAIVLNRTKGVGVITRGDAINSGMTGPNLRATGVMADVRKDEPYGVYPLVEFDIPTQTEGDCYARYRVRIMEIFESIKIVRQAIRDIPSGPIVPLAPEFVPPPKFSIYRGMEELIHHYILYSIGFHPPIGEVYVATESPRGTLGCYLVSDGSPKPFRVRFRPPSFIHLSTLKKLAVGHQLADIVPIIGSIDFVVGEVDR